MAKIKIKKGFTLIEVVIAISIFAVLAIMTIQIFSNISRVSKKVEIQEYVFSEAEAAMEKIIREVQRSAIDYSEYYSRNVLESDYYGQNYGAYKATFYDPGSGGPLSVGNGDGGDGIYCADSLDEYFFTEDCADFDSASYDSDTGAHYADDPEEANAFCEDVNCENVGNSLQSELYLINSSGSKKTIFVRELKDDGGYVISMLEMDGVDGDVDGDAISDYWQCASDYICDDEVVSGYAVPEGSVDLLDGEINDNNFEPVTPDGLDIIDLHFFIVPLEDPYMGFAETDDATMQHPHVIVVMTVAPSFELSQGLLGEDWTLTLQGTASTGVSGEVPSEYRGGWRY